jgi:hypothetical protein
MNNLFIAFLSCCLSVACSGFWRSNGGFQGSVKIISAAPTCLSSAYGQPTLGLVLTTFSFFLSFHPLIYFHACPSICFSLKSSLYSFGYYLFIWNDLYNLIFFISCSFNFFLLYLVYILLIAVYFIFYGS